MIQISPSAQQELKRLQQRQPHHPSYLTLGLDPGGCADWVYHLDLTTTPDPAGIQFDCPPFKVVLAPQNLDYLDGLNIDYSEDLVGGGFRFHNPNAAQHCGCGGSFSLTLDTEIETDCQDIQDVVM